MSVDTACSSSLVAAHLGHGSLLSGKSSDSVVAGSHLTLDPYGTAAFITFGMLAEDGRCKTLDSMADGYVRGDGCGMLLLQDADEDAVWRPCAGGAVVGCGTESEAQTKLESFRRSQCADWRS